MMKLINSLEIQGQRSVINLEWRIANGEQFYDVFYGRLQQLKHPPYFDLHRDNRHDNL